MKTIPLHQKQIIQMKNKIKSIIGVFSSLGTLIPQISYAEEVSEMTTSTPLGEVSTFGELISLVWAYGVQVLIAFGILFIVLGAFFYVGSAGNEERKSQGREMIFGSIIGIIITMGSGVLIRMLHKPAEGTSGALAEVPEVIGNASNMLIGIIASFSVLMLVYAGLLYVTGKGDAEKIDKAHNAFKYSIYGLIIGILAYAITNTVVGFIS